MGTVARKKILTSLSVAVLEDRESGGYVARVLEYPSAIGEGDSVGGSIESALGAYRALMEYVEESGGELHYTMDEAEDGETIHAVQVKI